MFLTRVLILTLVLALISCSKKAIKFSGKTMGTQYNISVMAAEGFDPKDLKSKVDELLIGINKQMSTYIAESEISGFNATDKNVPYKISADFLNVVKFSMKLAEKTQGYFDPTLGPLINLWGFGPKGFRKAPSLEKIEEVKAHVGYNKLKIENGKLVKTHSKIYLDLSAVAKGYGVDVVSSLLTKEGFEHHMVEIGGEVKVRGKKGERFWRIGIESPNFSQPMARISTILPVSDIAIATSGSYRNFYQQNGNTYSHTIDFMTGKPVSNKLISVSVLDSSCMKADALATGFMAMGLEKALEYSNKENIASYFIYRDKTGDHVKSSKVFAKRFPDVRDR